MAISLDPAIPMPARLECLAYSAEASKLLPTRGAWINVQRKAANSLRMFNSQTGYEAAAWFGLREFRNRRNEPDHLVTVYFSTDAPVGQEQLRFFDRPFSADLAPWTMDGVFKRDNDAFPSLYVRGTRLYQLWNQAKGQLVVPSLGRDFDGATIVRTPYNEARPSDFLPHIRHAVGTFEGMNSDTVMHKERLKLAFAMHVVQDIVAADGVIDPGEVKFLRDNFPPRRLMKYNLTDPGERGMVYDEARRVLKGKLVYHEKLALLSTFFATCSADGKIDATELVVLKRACTDLGIPRTEVATHLSKLW